MTIPAPAQPSDPEDYLFTNDWFAKGIPVWDRIVLPMNPAKILEVGCFEGQSACYMIERCTENGAVELYCVDTWLGGVDHDPKIMSDVEKRFDHNVNLALKKTKNPCHLKKMRGFSQVILPYLIASNHAETFDVIYIDGSHQAPDVLMDAVLSFRLLKVGGLMIFDDYVWHMEALGAQDSLNMPKPAIDAFLNIFQRKMRIISGLPLYQLYVRKNAS